MESSVKISYEILLPQFFRKFFVKSTFTKELYSNFIWRKKSHGSEFLVFPHYIARRVEITGILSHAFLAKKS